MRTFIITVLPSRMTFGVCAEHLAESVEALRGDHRLLYVDTASRASLCWRCQPAPAPASDPAPRREVTSA